MKSLNEPLKNEICQSYNTVVMRIWVFWNQATGIHLPQQYQLLKGNKWAEQGWNKSTEGCLIILARIQTE